MTLERVTPPNSPVNLADKMTATRSSRVPPASSMALTGRQPETPSTTASSQSPAAVDLPPPTTEQVQLLDSQFRQFDALAHRERFLSRSAQAERATTATETTLAARAPVAACSKMASLRESRAAAIRIQAFFQQAAYILAREILNRPLTKEQKQLMWRANEVRTEVLKALPLGRSNVVSDYNTGLELLRENHAISGSHGTYRALAARQLKWNIPNGSTKPHIAAALAAVAGSGSCGDHANIAMHLFAKELKPGERLIKQKSDNLDHAWLRIEGAPSAGSEQDMGPSVILDAWADGPVIDPSDGTFSSTPLVSTIHVIDAKDGLGAYEAFQHEMVAKYETQIAALANKIERDRNTKHRHQGSPPISHPLSDVVQWPPAPVLEHNFMSELKRSDLDVEGKLELKAQALRIAREAPSLPELKDIKNLADIIIAATQSLEEATDRFLVPFTPVGMGLVAPSNDTTTSPPTGPEAAHVAKISRTLSY